MLLSKNWLADFVNIDATTNIICEKLTALGLEVEGISKAAPKFSGVVVGRVVALDKHPDADKLRVAKVDIGAESLLQIVCGAPNVAIDMQVPVATVGALLPHNFKIKQAKLRGVESQGMLCSESELGLAESTSGLMCLPQDMVLGENIREALALDDDIIEIGLTPNRGDCLSMLGVARELAVAFEIELKRPMISSVTGDGKSPEVHLTEPNACPNYIARTISGIDNQKASPLWLVERLRRAGIRSLSPVVDVTNYVMLMLGTPMHAFDATKISGAITVRLAKADEKLTLLDGKEVTLDTDVLVIADAQKALAMAGIMGGANSVIDTQTSTIVLEAAWFSPEAITGRARRLSLQTDASHRFERGVDFTLQAQAIECATQLIIEICGGTAHQATEATEAKALPQRPPVSLRGANVDAILGFRFPKKEIASILTRLGMAVTEGDKNTYTVVAPSYRFDIVSETDLIEELARVWGYAKVPASAVQIKKLPHQNKQDLSPRRTLNQLLVGMGYHEAITYSFVDEKLQQQFSDKNHAIQLINPLSAELSVMRTSLLPSLVKALSHNTNRQQEDVRLYELGHGYHSDNGTFVHTEKLAGIATGAAQPMQWGFRQRPMDFFDIKGSVAQIFHQFGLTKAIRYQRSERAFLHPGQSAEIFFKDHPIGFVGALHPSTQKALGIETKVLTFELDITKMETKAPFELQDFSKYPKIRRDISFVLAQGHPSAEIIKAIHEASNELVTDVQLFDVYVGRNIPKNTKSMAFAVYLQETSKTLTDAQADEVITKIKDKLAKTFNAELRG